jgi:hypothetical protein
MLQPPEAACGRLHDAYPGRSAGRWPGRLPGRPERPPHLPPPARPSPQVSGEMDLGGRTGTDD